MFGENVPVRERFYFPIDRRVTANKTVEGWREIPIAGFTFDLDVTNLMAFIEERKRDPEFAGVRVTVHAVFLKLFAEGLKASPTLNAYVRYNRKTNVGEVIVLDEVNIAMPVLLDDGRMLAPVLKQVDKKTLKEVCRGLEELHRRLRNTNVTHLLMETGKLDTLHRLRRGDLRVIRRLLANVFGKGRLHLPNRAQRKQYHSVPETERLTPDDILSATVLVTNIGSEMKELRAHIGMIEVIPPQACVLGVCAVRKQPVVMTDAEGQDRIEIRQVVPITLYVDHRANDFAHVQGFLRVVHDLCENPAALLSC